MSRVKMLNKRGQVTLYIIIAIIIVAAVLLFIFLRPQIQGAIMTEAQAKALLESKAPQIKSYVEDCMTTVARKSVNTMGRQGGKIFPSANYLAAPGDQIKDAPSIMNYALFKTNEGIYMNMLPSISEMSSELTTFLEGNSEFSTCINNLNQFKQQISVTTGVFYIKNIDMSNRITITFSYPVTISIGKTSMIIDDYTSTIPIDIMKIRDTASLVINKIAQGGNYIQVIQDAAFQQELESRQNANAPIIKLNADSYEILPSSQSGVLYDNQNLLFNIEYIRNGLDPSFKFNFLVGNL